MLKSGQQEVGAELAMDDRVTGGHEGEGVGSVEGCPLPSRGALPRIFLNFTPGNGAFWCTFYAIFYSQLA